jgi:hypothetical protein
LFLYKTAILIIVTVVSRAEIQYCREHEFVPASRWYVRTTRVYVWLCCYSCWGHRHVSKHYISSLQHYTHLCPAALPGRLARPPCPAALPDSLTRPPCPAALPGSLARQPCPAALPGSLARQPCPAALPGSLARPPSSIAFFFLAEVYRAAFS